MRIPEGMGFLELDTRYPAVGAGFPRGYVDQTPQEILYDPTRVLGTCGRVFMIPTGETILRQPRLETQAYTMVET